jgi:hypothetical protein
METITLQFQTPQDLSGFRKVAKIKVTEVSIRELTVVCDCENTDIALAMNSFGAVVIKSQQFLS